MNKKRLLRLADLLETIPPERFDLDDWCKGDKILRKNDCGTVGCAVGWGATIFRDLKLVPDNYDGEMDFAIAYKDLKNWDAVHAFFEIRDCDSTHLFAEEGYPTGRTTPLRVAYRIREFVEAGE